MVKLDIGCGAAKTPGAIGLDRLRLPGADVVCELAHFPWPIASDCADHVLFNHSIQYLGPFPKLLQELRRLCKNGAVIEIRSPHFSSYNYFSDPQYCFPLAWRSFDFWSPKSHFSYNYSARDGVVIRVLERHISFNNGPNPWRWLGIQALANRFPRFYERFLTFVLPAQEIRFKLMLFKTTPQRSTSATNSREEHLLTPRRQLPPTS